MSNQSAVANPRVVSHNTRIEKRAAPTLLPDNTPIKRAQVEKDSSKNTPLVLAEESVQIPALVNGIEVYVARVKNALVDWLPQLEMSLPYHSRHDVAALFTEYVNFLAIKLFLSEGGAGNAVSPSATIDAVWHHHILDTARYIKFCNDVGHFFHHSPNNAQDRDARDKRLVWCRKVYATVFRATPPDVWYESAVRQDDDNSMRVYVRTLLGKTNIYSVLPDMTIRELKCMVYGSDGIPIDQQRFIFDGKQLEDSKTVSDYKITPEITIHMVLRLKGC